MKSNYNVPHYLAPWNIWVWDIKFDYLEKRKIRSGGIVVASAQYFSVVNIRLRNKIGAENFEWQKFSKNQISKP